VKDTGCGMDKDILGRIFEPYFTTRKAGEGSGFGLALVHGIVNSHNGYIKVYSEPDKGTTFHIFFPKIKTDVQEHTEALKEVSMGKEHILIVDDEEKLIYIMEILLKTLGYNVTSNRLKRHTRY
jgi:phosphoglycerate-specific signal transduction histidine kinase